jgi:hypothetical protein
VGEQLALIDVMPFDATVLMSPDVSFLSSVFFSCLSPAFVPLIVSAHNQ